MDRIYIPGSKLGLSEHPSVKPLPMFDAVNDGKEHDPKKKRQLQLQDWAIRAGLKALADGYDNIVLTAPWGIGKSYISMQIAYNYKFEPEAGKIRSEPDHILDHGRQCMTTPYTNLQTQYLRDFHAPDHGRVLLDIRGRNRFPCGLQDMPEEQLREISQPLHQWVGVQADEAPCNYDRDYQGYNQLEGGYRCEARSEGLCGYYNAKDRAMKAPFMVTNPDYLFRATQSTGKDFQPWDLLIVDEAHQFADKLVGIHAYEFTQAAWDRYDLSATGMKWPEEKKGAEKDCAVCGGKGFSKRTGKRCSCRIDWGLRYEWWIGPEGPFRNAVMTLNERAREISLLLQQANTDKQKRALKKRRKRIIESRDKIQFIIDTEEMGWVVDRHSYKTTDGWKTKYVFRPLDVSVQSREALEKVSKKRILMSATIFRPDIEIQRLGLDPEKTVVIAVTESPYPVPNRIVNIDSRWSQVYKERAKNEPPMVNQAVNLLKRFQNEGSRALVLPYTKRLQKILIEKWESVTGEECKAGSDSSYLIWNWDYNKAVHLFNELYELDKTHPCALLSTVGTGIDLKGDRATKLIIMKSPNASMADRWVKAMAERKIGREAVGWHWYAALTAQDFVQFTGRVIRSVTDKAEIHVLDAYLANHINKNRRLYPQWFLDAVRIDGEPLGEGTTRRGRGGGGDVPSSGRGGLGRSRPTSSSGGLGRARGSRRSINVGMGQAREARD